ncbi:MAG: putative toxin-antitoxin system toxin component, PIN family [Candidatus Dormibacteria bacterium]
MPEPEAPTRVVLDVNALVDGAYPNLRRTRTPGGRAPRPDEANPGRLLALFREDRGRRLFLSTHIVTETLRVLQLAPPEGSGMTLDQASAYAAFVVSTALESGGGVVEPDNTVNVLRDREDNVVLGTAVAAKASTIVTADKGFLALERWNGVAVVSTVGFVEWVEDLERRELAELKRRQLAVAPPAPRVFGR